jgi:hypothetical protein
MIDDSGPDFFAFYPGWHHQYLGRPVDHAFAVQSGRFGVLAVFRDKLPFHQHIKFFSEQALYLPGTALFGADGGGLYPYHCLLIYAGLQYR